MGRCVYGGVFEPSHPEAGPDGLRETLDLTRKSSASRLVRYPGGNFVSGYRWEDGVGPTVRTSCTTRSCLARSVESNTFGLAEFMSWCEPGQCRTDDGDQSRHPRHPRGLRSLSNTRTPGRHVLVGSAGRSHGHPEPYAIKLWCLGNEMDGPWQIGHKNAEAYGILATECAKAMRQVDPTFSLCCAAVPALRCRRSVRGRRPLLSTPSITSTDLLALLLRTNR